MNSCRAGRRRPASSAGPGEAFLDPLNEPPGTHCPPTCASSPTVSTRFLQGCQMTSSENSEVTRYLYSMLSLQARQGRQAGEARGGQADRHDEAGWVDRGWRRAAGGRARTGKRVVAPLHGGDLLPLASFAAAPAADCNVAQPRPVHPLLPHAPHGQLRLAAPHAALRPLELDRLLPASEGSHHADGLPKVRLQQAARGGRGQRAAGEAGA